MKTITSSEVFTEIRCMAQRTIDPCHRLFLNDLAIQLSTTQDTLLVLLIELENRGLVKIFRSNIVSVSLSNYGLSQVMPSRGLDSE